MTTFTATPREIIAMLKFNDIEANLEEMGGGVGAVVVPVVLHPHGEVAVLIGTGNWNYKDMDRRSDGINVAAEGFDGMIAFGDVTDPDAGKDIKSMDELLDAVYAAIDALYVVVPNA